MADGLPKIHIGQIDEMPVDLDDPATAKDGEPDNDADDEQKQTPPWVKAALGFDPANEQQAVGKSDDDRRRGIHRKGSRRRSRPLDQA
jgi:hypothetical protein